MTKAAQNPNSGRCWCDRHSSFVSDFLFWLQALCIWAALTFALRAFAHDPYEITSTLSLYSNRAELQVELEFRAGMLLSGHAEPVEASEAPSQFETIRSGLTKTAARFFHLSTGNNLLEPASTAVTLGVENHIRVQLSYPPLSTNAFSLDVPGLKSLSDQGPY